MSKKTAIGRFSFYLIHLYSHSETAAIEVEVRIGQLWCPGVMRKVCRMQCFQGIDRIQGWREKSTSAGDIHSKDV